MNANGFGLDNLGRREDLLCVHGQNGSLWHLLGMLFGSCRGLKKKKNEGVGSFLLVVKVLEDSWSHSA